MAEYTSLGDFFGAVADAIREKKGTTDKIKPIDFPSEIASIESGGSSGDVVTVSFYNYDGTLLYQKPTIKGDDCVDVVAKGLVTPTRESDVQYNYSFKGWSLTNDNSVDSNVFNNITEDISLYACYSSSIRYYNIQFYDGETLLETLSCAYGSTPKPSEPFKENYVFMNWEPELTTVTGETSYYAQFEYDDGYIKDSWEVIAENVANGTYKEKYAIGDMKQISLPDYNGTTYTLDAEIVGFDKDDLADGSGKAGITFITKQVIRAPGYIKFSSNYTSAWEESNLRKLLRKTGSTFKSLPGELQNAIKTVSKSSNTGKPSGSTYKTVQDELWVPSYMELGGVNTNYLNSVDTVYSDKFTDDASRIKSMYNGTTLSGLTRYGTRTANGIGTVAAINIYTGADLGAMSMESAYNTIVPIGFCI